MHETAPPMHFSAAVPAGTAAHTPRYSTAM
jgi:hypothetical protein